MAEKLCFASEGDPKESLAPNLGALAGKWVAEKGGIGEKRDRCREKDQKWERADRRGELDIWGKAPTRGYLGVDGTKTDEPHGVAVVSVFISPISQRCFFSAATSAPSSL